ncbi:MAG TPA: glycosyltransferase family 39 protein [Bryobacteraceae bacterium]|nr:glycosyltransferase family 39 protein [Bryobacteraceae bacterium]
MKSKLATVIWWALPPAFALYVYWSGIFAWFQQDDFAWLNLQPALHTTRDLLAAVFLPAAHGTWRPLPERAYFITLQYLFGYNALPYRLLAFITQCANFALVAVITRRLSGSRLAGLLAALFWIACWQLIVVMSWSSEYILPACGFCILLAFYLFLRYAETGQRNYWAWCWAVFLAGFLMMESNIVLPLLAVSYAFLFARPVLRKSLLLLIPSAIYGIAHLAIANRHGTGVYAMHFGFSMLATLGSYLPKAFEVESFDSFTGLPAWYSPVAAVVFGAALSGFVLWRALRRDWLPAMLVAWFVFLLAPVLPLRDHVVPYYLTLSMIPLSMLAALAVARAWNWRASWPLAVGARALATALAIAFLVESVPVAKGGTTWWADNSHQVERLARYVFRLHARCPEAIIVLRNVQSLLFWTGLAHHPFWNAAGSYVYLASGSEQTIESRPETGFRVADFIYPDDRLKQDLIHNRVIVVDVSRAGFFDVTSQYRVAPNTAALH